MIIQFWIHVVAASSTWAAGTLLKEGVSSRNDLRTTHEEVDVIILQQMVLLGRERGCSVKIICDDTDVFLLLLHHYHYNNIEIPVVMEGTSSKRVVCSIQETVAKNRDIITSLLAARAITGCDTTACMLSIAKSAVVKIMGKGKKNRTARGRTKWP